MTYIPKVQEQEYQRKMRVIEEQLDRLTGEIEGLRKAKAEEVVLPDPKQAVPESVQFAAAYVARFQAYTSPMSAECDIAIDWRTREPDPAELETLSSACELLTDYFDRHNSRVIRERQRAELLPAPTEPLQIAEAIPVISPGRKRVERRAGRGK